MEGIREAHESGRGLRYTAPMRRDGPCGGELKRQRRVVERRWRRDLNAAVTGLLHLDDGDEEVVAAGTSEGWFVLLSLEGEVAGNYNLEGGVSALAGLSLIDRPGLLA